MTAGGAELGESSFGLMSVSYDHEWTETSPSLQLKSRAQFVHYIEMDGEHVARLLGLPLDPQRDLPAEEACKRYDVTLDLEQAGLEQEEPGHVELLEAGDLVVRTVGSSVTLKPRHFPGLLPFISGVVYAEAQSMEEDRPGLVAVTTEGGEAVGAFRVETTSPQLPRLLSVAGEAPVDEVSVPAGAPLQLRWQAGGDVGDMTYVELRYSKGDRELALRCRPRDDGEFEIPASLVGQAAGAANGRLTLEMVRLRNTLFGATGLDRGELRVSVRDRAALLSP